MAGYQRPGVEVAQQVTTQTPTLFSPTLEACIVGHAYYWLCPKDDEAIVKNEDGSDRLYKGSELTIMLSGVNSEYYDISGDESLAIVDLVGISGQYNGALIHLEYGQDYTVPASSNSIVLKSGLYQVNSEGDPKASWFQIRVGYRAKKPNSYGYKVHSSFADAENILGRPFTFNPLSFGTSLAIANSARAVNTLGLDPEDETSSVEVFGAINDKLSTKEVYAIAPMTHNIDAMSLKQHCDEMSLPENKKERIAIVCKDIGNAEPLSDLSSEEKIALCEGIRDSNAAVQSRRIVSVHPDMVYVLETRHISTIKQEWINDSFSLVKTKDFAGLGFYAKLPSTIMVNGTKYLAGTDITDSLWSILKTSTFVNSQGLVSVLVPAPGFFYSAVIAGQVIGTSISQPLTNYATAGLFRVAGSQDLLSEKQLNIIAEGGTWIMTQDSPNGAIYCRHQMSTDFTSVTKRELSITKAVDYSAKFVRKSLKPYIGKYNITPDLLAMLGSMLKTLGDQLVKEGYVSSFAAGGFSTDPNYPDTLKCDINIKPLYPVNYIKVTIIF